MAPLSSAPPSVVPAKLARPRVERVVPRPRLQDLLDKASGRPLTWVHGGPGAGKTMALAELAGRLKPAPVWLDVDAGDEDVAIFFDELTAAARLAWPRRKLSLPKLYPEQQAGAVATYARRFFTALLGRSSAVFIFDDLHRLPEDSVIHEALIAAVEVIGDRGRIIVASRAAPPAAYARLRVGGVLAYVEPDALRFDRNELESLVSLRKLEDVPHARLEAMHDLTGGWAAGLTLALESGLTTDSSLPGREEMLFNYFMTEVLQSLDDETVHLLMSTAFLHAVDVKLAEKLSGDQAAAQRLGGLQKRALFVMRDSVADRYRYHDLFRDFLQAECRRRLSKEAFRELRIRTANALLDAGETARGADLLVEAEAWEELAQVVLGGAAWVAFAGRFRSLARWLEAMPETIVASSPWLGYWLGLAYLLSAPEDACRVLAPVVSAFAEAEDDLGYCLAYSALATAILAARHDMRAFDRLIETLYERIGAGWSFPSDHAEAHIASAITIALAFRAPNHPDVERWRRRARELEPLLPTTELRAVAQIRIGLSALWSGDFALASTSVRAMRELTPADEEPSPFQTGAATSVEQYLMLYTQPSGCREIRNEGLRDAKHHGLSLWTPTLELHDCAASLSLGRVEEGRATLDRVATEVQSCTRVERGYYSELRAWQALLEGEPDRAMHHAEDALRIGEAYGATLPVLSSSYAIALAAHGLGDAARALSTFDMLLEQGRAIRYLTFQTEMARAEVNLAQGNEDEALRDLRTGLELGRTIGCFNYIHWRSDALVPLLTLALRHDVETPYVGALIRRHAIVADVAPDVVSRWPFPIRIRTLGALRVETEGVEEATSSLGGMRVQLLATLVAAPEDGMPLRVLADELWPDADGDRAMQSLHTTLHRLRKSLGLEDAVIVDGGHVRLDRRLCAVDAWQLEGSARPSPSDPSGGRFLDGVDLSPTALAYRQRLDALRA